MALLIDDDAGRMVSDMCDAIAVRGDDGRWTVSGRSGTYGYNQAITAMTIAECLADGCPTDGPLVEALEAELREESRDDLS